ncbi:MAG: response regulator transcription factor [Bdellovibrionales bacterium]
MAQTKVLIVDDEQAVREYLSTVLEDEGFVVTAISSGETLFDTLKSFEPNILLMDYRMPGQSGVELVKSIRTYADYKSLPIIMVTGVAGEDEKVAALETGADDYLVKPFLPKELGARIRAVLRRVSTEPSADSSTLENKGLSVDLKSHSVKLDGEEIHLTLTEFRILSELLKQKGQVLSRDRLRETALGNLNVTDRTIDVHMASLRKKLGRCGDDIQTVRGVGYRLSVD